MITSKKVNINKNRSSKSKNVDVLRKTLQIVITRSNVKMYNS